MEKSDYNEIVRDDNHLERLHCSIIFYEEHTKFIKLFFSCRDETHLFNLASLHQIDGKSM